MNTVIENLIRKKYSDYQLIAEKVLSGKRLSGDEILLLYQSNDLVLTGALANHVREERFGHQAFYNRNFHVEPTNICRYDCAFCSYSRKAEDEDSWLYTSDVIIEKIAAKANHITEVHIVGGVYPEYNLCFYGQLFKQIKARWPNLHIKALTAVELDALCQGAGVSIAEGLMYLKERGLNSIPGGGAEIFRAEVRRKICHNKSTAKQWLHIHQTAHEIALPSNATMLYGHLETYADRVDHLLHLRDLQDRTKGFNAFIPLKYRTKNNRLAGLYQLTEVSVVEDLKNYAVARLALDNIPHLKAYWPMIGRQTAQMSLAFGVDDLDGTIDDSTRIYSMAGAEDRHPSMSSEAMKKLIGKAGRQAIERDSLYNPLH